MGRSNVSSASLRRAVPRASGTDAPARRTHPVNVVNWPGDYAVRWWPHCLPYAGPRGCYSGTSLYRSPIYTAEIDRYTERTGV